jgi:hypothetical protein
MRAVMMLRVPGTSSVGNARLLPASVTCAAI